MATKLWFVVYIFGRVAATWGPLPYGMDECQARVVEHTADLDHRFKTIGSNNPHMVAWGRQVTRADVTMACVSADRRPGR